ncbi:MAG: prolyl oligopeptidase family serine peptidase, partial [Acidimicrobiia bacterium]
PEDLWNLKRVGQPEHIRGTNSAVVPVVTFDDENESHSVLYLVDRDGTTRQLTSSERFASGPAPSPDGSQIAFLAKSGDDKPQVHVIPLAGGEAHKVTDLPLGARLVTWIPGRDSLVVAAPVMRDHSSIEATAEFLEDNGDKKRPIVTEDRVFRHWKKWLAGQHIDHLFRVDLADDRITDLTPDLVRLIGLDDLENSLTVTPDGMSVIFTLDAGDPAWETIRFALHTVPTDGGTVERLATGDAVQQVRPRVSPDGSTLIYGTQYEPDYYADLVRIVAHHLATGTEQALTEHWDRAAGGWEFINNTCIVFNAEDEGRVRLYTLDIEGGDPVPQTSTGSNQGPRPGVDCFWHRHESMHQPPEVAITSGGHTKNVSSFNTGALSELTVTPAEEIRFEGSEGAQLQAFIIEPPGFDDAQQWPLLHNVHGGPHNGVMDSWHWRWNTQVMAAAGYVVVSVNFHGSSSFGDAFTRSIRGAWGDMPARDIEAATDHMVSLGYIDENRMAIAGGSYGGYLVTWLTTLTDRYAASICHAGVTDLLGQWASDHTAGRETAVGGVPWEDMDAVQRWSPMAHTHDITTPTLVIHGELDYRVVMTQGLVLYGTLKAKGVPSRLVYYPSEGHWIESRDNALHWWAEFISWLDRWIG